MAPALHLPSSIFSRAMVAESEEFSVAVERGHSRRASRPFDAPSPPGLKPHLSFQMPKKDDPVQSMKATARNLALQAKKLREQAHDLSLESSRVRAASKKARQARVTKRPKT